MRPKTNLQLILTANQKNFFKIYNCACSLRFNVKVQNKRDLIYIVICDYALRERIVTFSFYEYQKDNKLLTYKMTYNYDTNTYSYEGTYKRAFTGAIKNLTIINQLKHNDKQ